MEWVEWLFKTPISIIFILTGLLLLVASFISLGSMHITDPADRKLARRISYFLLALGIFLQFSPVIQDYLQSSSPQPQVEKEDNSLSPSTSQYTLKTFRKDRDRKTYKSSFSSTEQLFPEENDLTY